MDNQTNFLSTIKYDFKASIVVFLVALPLCLGIALASGAPLYSGLIAGIVGGIVVGSFSGSALGVSGPAAGLAVIVLNSITELVQFEYFLVAVVLAGVLQLIMGFVRAGIIAHYFPSSVIHGMLAGIGILIFLKQIPHAFGYNHDPEGDLSFIQMDGHNTFSELINMLNFIHPGALIITLVSLGILLLWETKLVKKISLLSLVPGPLLAVVAGIICAMVFNNYPSLSLGTDYLVALPVATSMNEFLGNFSFPDFTALSNPKIYSTALIIAVVASLETLLSVEATDKQDPLKRVTPTNKELKAQGLGNIISGLIGGIPITQVIVRSSANQQSGARSKMSAVMHGIFLLLSVMFIPALLNMIPLASLAGVLLVIGFKLAKPAIFMKMYRQGKRQFFPFVVTIIGMLLTDLLTGIVLGLVVAVFIILRNNYKIPFRMQKENLVGKHKFNIVLSQDVTFLNKASIQKSLDQIPAESHVSIDASNTHFIHHDVLEIIEDFKVHAKSQNIEVTTIDLYQGLKKEPLPHYKLKNNGKTTIEK